jgi:hypothetical protein
MKKSVHGKGASGLPWLVFENRETTYKVCRRIVYALLLPPNEMRDTPACGMSRITCYTVLRKSGPGSACYFLVLLLLLWLVVLFIDCSTRLLQYSLVAVCSVHWL